MGSSVIQIEVNEPFNYDECLWYLDRGFQDPLHHIDKEVVYKGLRLNGGPVQIKIEFQQGTLQVFIDSDISSLAVDDQVEKYVRSWFDIDRDLAPFRDALSSDKLLGPLLSSYRGLRLIGIEDLFEALCWSVIGQQVNLTFAHKMKRAMVETYGEKMSLDNKPLYLFPAPEVMANVSIEDLKGIQFSRQKATYVIALAKAFAEGTINQDGMANLDLPDQIETLTALHGIGNWSAHYVAMRCLKAMDALPSGDVGLQNAIKSQMGLESKPSALEVEETANAWSGWKAYATLYLWRSLALYPPARSS